MHTTGGGAGGDRGIVLDGSRDAGRDRSGEC